MAVDPITIISAVFGAISGIDHCLSFSPDGYPKSLIQAFIWIGHKIHKRFKKKPKKSEPEEELLREVVL